MHLQEIRRDFRIEVKKEQRIKERVASSGNKTTRKFLFLKSIHEKLVFQ